MAKKIAFRDRSPFGQRMYYARHSLGLRQEDVRDALGMAQSTIGELESKGKSTGMVVKLAELYFVDPKWLSDGEGEIPDWYDETATDVAFGSRKPPQPRGAVAHDTILSLVKVRTRLSWECLVLTQLPEVFDVALPDESMASRYPAGAVLTFSTVESPRAGDVVLLSDKNGNPYCREYVERTPGHWLANPFNSSFLPLDSIADGLKVVAVKISHHVVQRDSDKT